jgi:2-dehydro-3-deoxyphosphogluconate aldolase/(4S)-4-hydroxy-2-oxoglutarate aldolase
VTISLTDALAACPVIAIIRAEESRHLRAVVETLFDGGVRAVELTLTTPNALDTIAAASGEEDRLLVGAGTVLTAEDARAAVEAGARYLITPAVLPEVIEEGARLGVPVLPGAATPTEILQAWRLGAALVKVFPAGPLGGPAYLRAVRAPLPDVPLVPTGGVGIEEVPAYLHAGAHAVGMGAPLLGDVCADGDMRGLAGRTRRLVAMTEEAAGA